MNTENLFSGVSLICSILAGKTKRGELSIFPKSFIVLSHCLHMMPRQKAAQGSENANLKVNEPSFYVWVIWMASHCVLIFGSEK